MAAVPLSYYLILSAALFALGAVGVILRRNALVMLMAVELMLNAANLALIAYARQWADASGQAFALLVMAVAAAEAAVGLAIVVAWARHRDTTDVDQMDLLKG